MSRGRFRRFGGIDFSGATYAGEHCWFASGTEADGDLVIDRLERADALPGGGKDRANALSALRLAIESAQDQIVGCDFPFSLPKDLLGDLNWREWLTGTMASYQDADAFRDACRDAADGREWRRATDLEAGTPFSPYNLRLFRQTYWGLTGVLLPLVNGDKAVVLPLMQDKNDRPALIETCPASVLKRWFGAKGNARYKQSDINAQARRSDILSRLSAEGVVIPGDLAQIAVETSNGDPLDSILAAYATWQASLNPTHLRPRSESDDGIEARVYF